MLIRLGALGRCRCVGENQELVEQLCANQVGSTGAECKRVLQIACQTQESKKEGIVSATVQGTELHPSAQDASQPEVGSFFFLSFASPDNLQIQLLFFSFLIYFVRQGEGGVGAALLLHFLSLSPECPDHYFLSLFEACLHLFLLCRDKDQAPSASIATLGKVRVLLSVFPDLGSVKG